MSRNYRIEIDTSLGDAEQARMEAAPRPQRDTPFRIAVVGDFSGRASRGVVQTGRALAARPPIRVDRDNVDEVLGRLAPEVELTLGGAATTITFADLEDFHPDRLYERLPAFRALRDTRERAAAPAPFAGTGRQTRRSSTGRAAPSPGGLLDQILGDVPAPPGAAAAPAGAEPTWAARTDPLTDFVRRAVAPHVVSDTSPAQPERVQEVEAIVGADLRSVLHDPHFQALESAWRAVDFLVRRLETSAALQVHLIDASKAELAADLADADDPTKSDTYRILVEASVGTAGAAPWALIVGLFTVDAGAEDVALLRRLGRVARAAGAPFIASADSRLVGSPSFGAAPDPDDWSDAATPEWDALRRSADAPYVGLAAPRFLLRLPYGGADGAPCDVPGFVELSSASAHDEYLWGSSAVLVALLQGEAFASEGWALRPRLDVPGLPLYLIRSAGEVTAKPCAEAVLSERAVNRILDRGVIAVQSLKDGDAVRLARLQSIAEPLAALAHR
jgi:type VI secretion system protein ImpC